MIRGHEILRAWGVAVLALVAAWAIVRFAGPPSEVMIYLLLWATSCAVPAALTLRWARRARRRGAGDDEGSGP
jgi:hypothetical protein